jgi:transposase
VLSLDYLEPMRGRTDQQMPIFSVIPVDSWIESSHPLRAMADLVDPLLAELSKDFDAIYSKVGRPSIPPEQLLKALLLQVLYTIRSEGQLLEHLRFNLLYRWFVGLAPDSRIWDETVFSKNRERLLKGDIAHKFFEKVLEKAGVEDLISSQHFSVDGTQIQAWASHKSFQPKEPKESKSGRSDHDDDDPGNPSVDFHGEKRSNETHESKTDPESRLYKKSKGSESKLSYLGHALMENRNGLVVAARVTEANGTAERDAAMGMAFQLPGGERKTMGGDKNYDTKGLTQALSSMNVTPHVAQNVERRGGSAIDGRTTRHSGYGVSQRKRKLIEEVFGWLKTVGPMRRPHLRGSKKMSWWFKFSVAVYNLVRIRNLMAQTA